MRVRGRSDDGQVNFRGTSGESQSELDSVGHETCLLVFKGTEHYLS